MVATALQQRNSADHPSGEPPTRRRARTSCSQRTTRRAPRRVLGARAGSSAQAGSGVGRAGSSPWTTTPTRSASSASGSLRPRRSASSSGCQPIACRPGGACSNQVQPCPAARGQPVGHNQHVEVAPEVEVAPGDRADHHRGDESDPPGEAPVQLRRPAPGEVDAGEPLCLAPSEDRDHGEPLAVHTSSHAASAQASTARASASASAASPARECAAGGPAGWASG